MKSFKITSISIGMQKNARYYNIPSFLIKIEDKTPITSVVPVVKAKKLIKDNPQINHLVIYGDEPMAYKQGLETFLNGVWREGMQITVYTNGDLPAVLNPLSLKYKISLYVVKANTDKPNFENLRNICIYSNDYLLCFQDDPDKLEELSNGYVKGILNTAKEEFLINFLDKHSPYKHVVYIPRTKEEIKEVKNLCYKTGNYFNTFI